MFPAQCAVNLCERLEYPVEIFGRDPDPGIRNRDADANQPVESGGYADVFARWREFHGVAEQVEQDLAGLAFVAPKGG